jgi:hypothetical protein
MADWMQIYKEDLEAGAFYDQTDPEVTLPRGFRVVWITSERDDEYKRPEMDYKDKERGEPEVYEGRYSGVGFHRFTRFSWYLVSNPIAVTPGKATRAKAAVMVEAHGIEDDLSRPGACGVRVGLIDADTLSITDDDLSESSQQARQSAAAIDWEETSNLVVSQIEFADREIAWSKFWVVRGSLENERTWHVVRTDDPPIERLAIKHFFPEGDKVRLLLQCNADVAANISAGHYDDLIVEQRMD